MPQKRLHSDEVKFIMKMKEVKYSNREIARRLGITEGAVRYRLNRESLDLPDMRSQKPSQLDRYRMFMSNWISSYAGEKRRPTFKLLFSVLKEEFQYQGSYDALRRYVSCHFPDFHKKSSWLRIQTPPGVLMFVDWKEDLPVQLGCEGNWERVQALVFSLGFSGKMVVVYFDRKDLESFISGHYGAFAKIGGLVRFIRPDCLKSAVIRWKGQKSELNSRYERCLKRLGVEVFPSRPGHATDKGKVEKRIRDLFSSMDFKHRVFSDLKELQSFTDEKLRKLEQEWRSSSTGFSVEKSFAYEKDHLRPLPKHFPKVPVRERYLRVRTDGTVHFCRNYYQLNRDYIGKTVLCQNTGREIVIHYRGEEILRKGYLPGSKGMVVLSEDVLRDPELKISDRVRQWALDVASRQVDIYQEISNGGLM